MYDVEKCCVEQVSGLQRLEPAHCSAANYQTRSGEENDLVLSCGLVAEEAVS